MGTLVNKTNIMYVDTKEDDAPGKFEDIFHAVLLSRAKPLQDIVILCIGTDRATGDSLGPLVGYKLASRMRVAQTAEAARAFENVYVYGTLDAPVHARNIKTTLKHIENTHEDPLIVAIDASLGRQENVGCLTLGVGAIHPGAGLNKELPRVGDIFITGIVNYSGAMDMIILQNTRLGVVMRMADIVSRGILNSLKRLRETKAAV